MELTYGAKASRFSALTTVVAATAATPATATSTPPTTTSSCGSVSHFES